MEKCYVRNKQESSPRITQVPAATNTESGQGYSTAEYCGKETSCGFLYRWAKVGVELGKRNGFREPSGPACALVPHSCVILNFLSTLATSVCGRAPGRTGDQLVSCYSDESPSQVRVRLIDGCDIFHFYASGGRLSLPF